jgi:isopentenyl diphosphate isomerase/L-lactate dehydrogenase-like FMN-dependent dehydrogenase
MMPSKRSAATRRLFLQFLAASPLFASVGKALAEDLEVPAKLPDPIIWAPQTLSGLINSPKEAITVFDFEPVAKQNVPPAHFGYMASGIDDEVTLRANRADFQKVALRPRRLHDVSKVDASVEIFGVRYDSPIGIAPTGGNRAYDYLAGNEGEIAVSKAAKAGNHVQCLSTQASTSIDDAIAARGGGVWFQLYASPSWDIAYALVKRAENAGSPVLAITVDRVGGRNQEIFARLSRIDSRNCADCHDNSSPAASIRNKPNFEGIDVAKTGVKNLLSANMTWDFVKRMRDATKMKIVIKGILSPDDAKLCVENGVDGLIVSNHGGRAEDSGTSSISVLPEVVDVVGGRIPVFVDSGFRRGSDVVKALAIGAKAVFVGRPYLWGLGAFGQPGVERVLEILRTETQVAMAQCGAAAIKDLSPSLVHRAA